MKLDDLRSDRLFDLSHSLAGPMLSQMTWPWDILPAIRSLILALGPQLPTADFEQLDESIWVARDCCIAPTASISGPLIIGHESDIRHGAFIRTNALIGDRCVVGNSTELKNVILFDQVQVPHYNYIGDSLIGWRAHFGAGAITSNVRADRSEVHVRCSGEDLATELRKFGAIVGDGAEIGCNAVLNPGTVIGRGTQVYPLTSVRGSLPPDSILKQDGTVVARRM